MAKRMAHVLKNILYSIFTFSFGGTESSLTLDKSGTNSFSSDIVIREKEVNGMDFTVANEFEAEE
jgi:hypothetical protein